MVHTPSSEAAFHDATFSLLKVDKGLDHEAFEYKMCPCSSVRTILALATLQEQSCDCCYV